MKLFSEQQQLGDIFGMRLTHAVEIIFSEDYDNIIAIDNDCLTLTTADLLKTAEALSSRTLF